MKELVQYTTLDHYFEKIVSLVKLLEKHVPTSPYHIIGLGIAVPGIISTDGIILYAPNLQWRNVDLIEMLAPTINYPAIVTNEANAGAFAEFSYTYNQQHQHLLFVSIGYGIGVGIIVNGELILGEQGYSGESGHMIFKWTAKNVVVGVLVVGKPMHQNMHSFKNLSLDFLKKT